MMPLHPHQSSDWPGRFAPRWSVVLQAFFDDSGKPSDAGPVVLAGYAADQRSWGVFDLKWRHLLFRFGVSQLHMKHLMTSNREFKGWDLGRRNLFIAHAALILRQSDIVGFGVATDASFWGNLPPQVLKKHGDSAAFCFDRILRRIRDRMMLAFPNEYIDIVFDNDPEYSKSRLTRYKNICDRDSWAREKIASISFGRTSFYTPLQAADFLAWVSRRILVDNFKSVDPTLPCKMYFGGDTNEVDIAAGEYWDKQQFLKYVDIETGDLKTFGSAAE